MASEAKPAAELQRVLVADDQPYIGEALRLLLRSNGFATQIELSPAAVLEAVKWTSFDAVLMDLNYARDTTSGEEGLALVEQLHARDKALPIVVMTAWGSIPLAVEAMRRGARDFVLKPWDNAELLRTLRAHVQAGQTMRVLQGRERSYERELAEALAIQRRLLPQSIPQFAELEIAADWQPARVVGGDYFDVLPFGDSTAALCVADVAGKGMPAALLMSNLQAAVRAYASPGVSPATLCDKLNHVASGNSENGRFISFFYCVLDARRGICSYANAGHNPPLLVRRDASLERLTEGGVVLGEFPGAQYEQGQVALAAGDRLVLYIDGITEAVNAAGEEFGEARLIELVSQCRHLPAADLQQALTARVSAFAGGHFHDDATLIVAAL